MGHDTFRGLYMLECARINRVRMLHETNYRQRCIYRHCVLNSHVLQTVERILSKFAGNVLLLTISVKDYVLFMFTYRAHACIRMCAFAYFLTDYVQICWEHTTTHHKW
jgi:hypothetical protein